MLRSLTLANIKAIRDSNILKKNTNWILFAAVVILLLLLFVQWYSFNKRAQSKDQQINSLIEKSKDDSTTIQYFYGTNKALVASNSAVVADSRKMMQKVINWDSIAKQFRVPSKGMDEVIRERTHTDVVIPQDSNAIVFKAPDTSRNCPAEINALGYTFRNPWFVAETRIGTTKEDTGYIKLQSWDTLTAVSSIDKDSIKISISHSNPYIKTVGLQKYIVKPNTNPRPFNVSLSLGYGVVPTLPSGRLLYPFAGITIGKTIFRFGKRKP